MHPAQHEYILQKGLYMEMQSLNKIFYLKTDFY